MTRLPTFEDIRTAARSCLTDAQLHLRSDRRSGEVLTDRQVTALKEAREHIAAAKEALDRAAR